MDWVTLIVTILTVFIGPLFVQLLKWWAGKQAADEAAQKLRDAQEKIAEDARQHAADEAKRVNHSIQNETNAGQAWVDANPILPPKV